jgi:hypothetical protein
MDCFRWAKKDVGTAPFPKAKEYQKLKVGAYDQEKDSDSEIDLYTTDDRSSEEDGESSEEEGQDEPEDEFQEEFSEVESEKVESVSPEKNW